MSSPSRARLLSDLQDRIRQLEDRTPTTGRREIDLGIAAIEGWLPNGKLASGSLVELFPLADGAGALTLALFMARQACSERKVFVVVDHQDRFYPPAAAHRGIDLDRLIVVRPRTSQDARLALDQSLRASAVGSVLCWQERLATSAFRRLQLAAEIGGGLGLLLRPSTAQRAPSFAALRMLVAPIASHDAVRRIRLDLLRCRGGQAGQSTILELDDATGDVRVPSRLATATLGARTAGASG
jgi:protein ImuA